MAFVKISPQVKRQALDKVKQGMATYDAAKMFGISPKTMKQWADKESNSSLGSTSSQSSNPPPLAPTGGQFEDKATELDFQDAPVPLEKKSVVDSAFSSLKGMLGISDEPAPKKPPVVGAQLDKKRQQFVEAISPTIALAGIAFAAWIWRHLGAEYGVLAPDEKVAQQIVEPLVRIYARHSSFITEINPDFTDVAASLTALAGYVHVSMEMYQRIKQDKEYGYDQEQENTSTSGNYRGAATPQSEERFSNESDRSFNVRRRYREDARPSGGNGGTPGDINQLNLSDKEARQYAALSRLGQLDYLHRARRSGRAA